MLVMPNNEAERITKMNFSTLGKCIDQPIVLNKLQKKMPALLIGAGASYGVYDTYKSSKNKPVKEKKQKAIKNTIIISTTIAASLIGANGLKIKGKQIIPRLLPQSSLTEIIENNTYAVNKFLEEAKPSKKITEILNKAKNNALSRKEVEAVIKEIPESKAKKDLLEVILPEPENLDSKGILGEIKRLSLLGAIPVVGGIIGGIAADKVTKTDSKKSTSNKIKEGFYQYFANIFLCNVGACAALFAAEGLQKANLIKPLTPLKKMCVILTGITATGIIGGSYIANKMSQKIIDPLFDKDKAKKGKHHSHKGVYDERRPELADIALHADDIATAGVLSGFKWIEPALPMMYFVSGYRAGIGYRN